MAFDLLDSNGNAWRFDVTDAGLMTSTSVAVSGDEVARYISDFGGSGVVFQLGATTGGLITTTSVAASSQPNKIMMLSPSASIWYLIVTSSGILQMMSGTPNTPPVLGQALGLPTLPPVVQPGGAGFPVTQPPQESDAKIGRWIFGCGHSFNNMEVLKYQNGAQQSAFLCCPSCRYVQKIITPYSDIYLPENQILIA